LKEPIDGDCLILSGMEFQSVGAAKLKALRPIAVVVKGTCSRLCEEERRSLVQCTMGEVKFGRIGT